MDDRALVIIPTYNEAENIAPIVARVRANAPKEHILIVDDGSQDGTDRIADGLADDDHVFVMHRRATPGLGLSYLDGYRWARERGYGAIVQMDADGSHRPEELHRLMTAFDAGNDLVIGSRWVPGGRVVNWPKRREWLSRLGNRYARWMLQIPVRDITAGYRVVRTAALPQLQLGEVESQGYCFQVDITRRAAHHELHISEVPITFVERERGSSKMSGAIVREAMRRVTGWGIAQRWRRLRRRS